MADNKNGWEIKVKNFMESTDDIGKSYSSGGNETICSKAIEDISRLGDAVGKQDDPEKFGNGYIKNLNGLDKILASVKGFIKNKKVTDVDEANKNGISIEEVFENITDVKEMVRDLNVILKSSKSNEKLIKSKTKNNSGADFFQACKEDSRFKQRLKYLRGHFKQLYTEIIIYEKSILKSQKTKAADEDKGDLPDEVISKKIFGYLNKIYDECFRAKEGLQEANESGKIVKLERIKKIEIDSSAKHMNRLQKVLRYFLVYDPKLAISKNNVRNNLVDDGKFIDFCIIFEKTSKNCKSYSELAFKIDSLTKAINQSTCKEVKRIFDKMVINRLKSTKKIVEDLNDANDEALAKAAEKTKKNNA